MRMVNSVDRLMDQQEDYLIEPTKENQKKSFTTNNQPPPPPPPSASVTISDHPPPALFQPLSPSLSPTTSHHHPRQSALHTNPSRRRVPASRHLIPSPSQQRRCSVIPDQSSVGVSKVAAISAVVVSTISAFHVVFKFVLPLCLVLFVFSICALSPSSAFKSLISGSCIWIVVASSDSFTIKRSSGSDDVILPTTVLTLLRSTSVHGCSEMQSQPSVPAQEDRLYSFQDVGTDNVSGGVLRRDMATQMSPKGSQCSSPNMGPLSSIGASVKLLLVWLLPLVPASTSIRLRLWGFLVPTEYKLLQLASAVVVLLLPVLLDLFLRQ
ncbi:hypothetical protein PIB30_086673 [Stylosanthes scabra]|uniref:Uncharacterized protein n=1 Tax=Stylosanthes scabra TaxID=79078 RepID=A0ABU6XUA4_9FABA|nr:hypothetical protein [Stylosanthes scabra]